MRRVLVVVGSLVVIAAVVFGVLRFTATDDATGGTAAGAASGSDGSPSTTSGDGVGGAVVAEPDDAASTTTAPRDASLDPELAAFLVSPAEYGAEFTALGPAPEEQATRCGTLGLDDPGASQGRAMVGVENAAGTLSVTQAVRAYADAQAAAVAYNGAVAAINCPLIELADGANPTATGSEVGGLGADQAYAIDYFPDGSAAAPTPIGGGFVARVGARVLTLRYLLDPADPAAAGYDLAAIVRAAIAKLTAG